MTASGSLRGFGRRLARRLRRRTVRWGSLRSAMPVSRVFGLDRGTPIDRVYIERFLGEFAGDIRGSCLEVAETTYMDRFGGERVTARSVLHAEAGLEAATLVGDLATGEGLPAEAFDCVILTQTLHCVYDIAAAVRHARSMVRPGGVALCTLPGISQVSEYDMRRWGDCWRVTGLAARRLFEDAFGAAGVEVREYGSVLTATAFLQGLAAEELTADELSARDEAYPLLVGVRAARGEGERS